MIRPTAFCLSVAAALLSGCTPVSTKPVAVAPTTVSVVSGPLLDDVRILSGDDMQGRDTGSAGGERARAYIVSRLEAMGVQPASFGRLQPFAAPGRTREGVKRFNGVNIVGLIPGTRVADRYIVVTAHYDHVGMNDGQIYHGADDNASGVATMLELARRLKAQAPEHSVLIVALDGEERGLLGAREFVKAPPVPLSSVSLNLNFDMTARAETDGHLWVAGGYQHPDLRGLLEPVAAQGPVSFAFGKDTPQDTGANNWVESSDHAAFHAVGVPFLYMGVDYHPDYHRPSDTFERITPAVFASATELAIAGFHALDKGLDR
nr:M28 family peptidase [uncultured Brevundimonas sp.]